MNPFSIAGVGLGLLSGVPQWMAGYDQEEKANELAKGLVRPDFEIPQAEKEALASAKAQAGRTRLPGQDAIEGRLDSTTANTIAMIERMGIGGPTSINAASSAYGNQLEKENELGIASGNMALKNQDIYRDQLGEMAGWENKAWQWDKADPYLQRATAIRSLREGGMRNKNAAWMNLFGTGANLLTGGLFGDSSGGTGGEDSSSFGMGESDPNSPLFKTDFKLNTRPLMDSYNYGGV